MEGLKGDTPYLVRVSVGNSVGFGPEKERTFVTLRPGYPGTPTSVQVIDVCPTSMKLAWEVVDIGQPNTEYCIYAIKEGSESKGELFTMKPEDVVVTDSKETAVVSSHTHTTCTHSRISCSIH